MKTPYWTNIEAKTLANEDYRRVLFTGASSQLVVMNIPPGGEIGEETHDHVEQTLVCVSGSGQAVLDGKPSPFGAGEVLVVPPGVRHNVTNAGGNPLKLFTVYAPPNHLDGRVHHTKSDAEADTVDEAFGHAIV